MVFCSFYTENLARNGVTRSEAFPNFSKRTMFRCQSISRNLLCPSPCMSAVVAAAAAAMHSDRNVHLSCSPVTEVGLNASVFPLFHWDKFVLLTEYRQVQTLAKCHQRL